MTYREWWRRMRWWWHCLWLDPEDSVAQYAMTHDDPPEWWK